MSDHDDVSGPDLREVARDAGALLRTIRNDEPKTLPRTADPEEES